MESPTLHHHRPPQALNHTDNAPDDKGLYIMLLSVHGLIRGEQMELGRDADTGGQVLYVVDLARSLARHPAVDRVDLVTRQVFDRRVDDAYTLPEEDLGDGARIVRLPFGPRRYLRKEALWPYLQGLVDQLTQHVRRVGRLPDVVHGHYGDAGQAGGQFARLLGVPFVFTGHSLGRVKRMHLRGRTDDDERLEKKYRLTQRIEAEEFALDTAVRVITSTVQEVEEQYKLYEHYAPDRMSVIPPGVDLDRFSPPGNTPLPASLRDRVYRFLDHPTKPMILAMARPDERKNFDGLLHAYGRNQALRDRANLVLILGTRDDIQEMPAGARRVLGQVLLLIDKYDLYGQVAYPKRHGPDEVPEIYRLAAASGGVFVNPALTEPFGLTLLEAAASGLPVVATNDGGPRDILAACQNGLLIDPTNPEELGQALLRMLTDPEFYVSCRDHGVDRVRECYAWSAHSRRYLRTLDEAGVRAADSVASRTPRSRMPRLDRIFITDLDNTLIGDEEALAELGKRLTRASDDVGFGIATGRPTHSALELLGRLPVPHPDVLITSSGTEIHYGNNLTRDSGWTRQIDYFWNRDAVAEVLADVPGLFLQEEAQQTPFKLSYEVDTAVSPSLGHIKRLLRERRLRAKTVFSLGMFLDVIPIRAGDGLAIRYVAFKWGMPIERILVAGDSGNDEEMLAGNTLGVVVGNYSPELEKLRTYPRVFFAEGHYARGLLEGLDHYQFLDGIQIPEGDSEMPPDDDA